MTVAEVKTELKPLIKSLPKTRLHNMYGICFDKKDTYTVTEVPVENIKNKTPFGILKSIGLEKTVNDKKTVIVFRHSTGWRENEISYTDYEINSYSACRKGDVLSHLKNATEIVVIQVDTSSLKFPKYTSYRDIEFYESREFNDDDSLTERVRFTELTHKEYSDELNEWVEVPTLESEIRNRTTKCNVNVQFLSSGRTLRLRKTIGNLHNTELWGEMIDKSGYNRNARLVAQHFKLREFKADKVRKEIKKGTVMELSSQIVGVLYGCKSEFANLSARISFEKLNVLEQFLDKISDLNSTLKEISKRTIEVGTKEEYTPYTITILDDLKETLQKAKDLLTEIRSTDYHGNRT